MSTFRFENNIKLDKDIEEEFDNLSHVIEDTSSDIRTIAITSSQSGEGKTFISFHLACSLARKGYRVAIVMADMRKTTQKDNKSVMGVLDIVEGKVELENVIYNTDIEGIDVIFSGATKKRESINKDKKVYSVMIKALKEDYNYIIVDMPTFNKTEDDNILLKAADAGILVIEPNRSSIGKLKKNIKLMEHNNCRVLGAVVNNK